MRLARRQVVRGIGPHSCAEESTPAGAAHRVVPPQAEAGGLVFCRRGCAGLRTSRSVCGGALASSCAHAAGMPALTTACSGERVAWPNSDATTIHAELVEAATMPQPVSVLRGPNGFTVTLAHEVMRLAPVYDPNGGIEGSPMSEYCRSAALAREAAIAREIDGVCLLGINQGEFGGWVEVHAGRTGRSYTIAVGNPRRFLDTTRGLWVFSGFDNGAESGGMLRLARGQDGTWCLAQSVDLHGNPIGWRVDSEGRFVLLVTRNTPARVENGVGTLGELKSVVVRVEDDGTVTPIE